MTKKLIGTALFVALFSFVGLAQEAPKPEVFGGYQFTTLDPSWHANGWNGAASMYFTRWLGVTGDFSGAYGSGSTHFYTYTGGPVVSMHKHAISPYAHALFGGGHVSSSGFGNNGMVMMFGGGLDYGRNAFAIRLCQADWMMTHFNGVSDKNNARVSTGLLYRF